MPVVAYAQKPVCKDIHLGDVKVGDLMYFSVNDRHYAIRAHAVEYDPYRVEVTVQFGDPGSTENRVVVDHPRQKIPVVITP